MGSKGSNTTSTTSSANPQAMQAYDSILRRATGVGNLPYQAYGGEGVAPINAQQMQGIQGINNYANYAQPFINMAAGYEQQAATPISAQDIQKYMDPFTNQVVNATQADFANQNAIQNQGVVGNAIAQGAMGGNREAVAAAEVAGQQAKAQAPVIAGLRSQGYNTGLNTALTEQQNLANAAYGTANLGISGQQAGLAGAGQQIGAGSMEQQTQQALDQYLYGQFSQGQAFPYQQLSWLAGLDTGVGSNMGGTSSTTGPPPSMFAQMAGLGAAGAGLFGSTGAVPWMQQHAAHGGRIRGYDEGGNVEGESWIPSVNITHGSGPPKPPTLPQASQSQGIGGLSGLLGGGQGGGGSGILGGLGNLFGGGAGAAGAGAGAVDATGAAATGGEFLADMAPALLLLARGGGVRGYDDGGGVAPVPYGGMGLPYTGGGKSFIPSMNIAQGSGPPKPPPVHTDDMAKQMKDIQGLTNALMGDKSQKPSPGIVPQGTPTGMPTPVGTPMVPAPNMPASPVGYDRNANPSSSDALYYRGGGVRGYADGGTPNLGRDPDEYPLLDPFSYTYDNGAPPPSPGSSGILSTPNGDDFSASFSPYHSSGILDQPRHSSAIEGIVPVPTERPQLPSERVAEDFNGSNFASPNPVAQKKLSDAFKDKNPWVMTDGPPSPKLDDIAPVLHEDNIRPDSPPMPLHNGPDGQGLDDYTIARGISPPPRALGYTDDDTVGSAPKTAKPSGIFSGIDLSANSKLWPALTAAGFGMMASRSPFPGVAIGEGGLQGTQTYNELAHQEATTKLKQQEIDQKAREMSQRANQFDRTINERREERMLQLTKPFEISDPANPGIKVPIRQNAKGELFNLDGTPYSSQKTAQQISEANLKGDEYIKTLPAGDQAQVRQAGQYMATIPSANSRSPDAQRIRREIFQAYPEVDERMYGAQSGAVRKFFAGPDADTIKSFNVAISHMDTLQKAANALQNGDIGLFNTIKNSYKQATGQEMPTDFNAVRDIVQDEIVKGIVGARAGVTEREEAHKRVERDFSQGQFDSVINKYKELMGGQMNGMRQKFVSTTGLQPEVFDRFLLPETKEQLSKHDTGLAPAGGTPAISAPAPGPIKIQNGNRFQQQPDGQWKYLGPAGPTI